MDEELTKRPGFLKRRSTALAMLLIFGTIIVSGGFLKIIHDINSPFTFLREVFARNQNRAYNELGEAKQKVLSLQTKDTDGDGLSDFEEMYIYSTSPYLEDTDSDGISDKQEIDNRDNPNCPAGRTCGSPQTTISEGQAAGTGSQQPASNLLSNSSSIRQNLIAAGMSPEFLNQIDDQALIKMYQETVQETGIDPSQMNAGQTAGADVGSSSASQAGLALPSADAQASAASQVIGYFQNMSADEIRQILISSGVSAEALQSIDDVALRDLLNQALQEQLKEQAKTQ